MNRGQNSGKMQLNSGSVLVNSVGEKTIGGADLLRKVRSLWDMLEVQLLIVRYIDLNVWGRVHTGNVISLSLVLKILRLEEITVGGHISRRAKRSDE